MILIYVLDSVTEYVIMCLCVLESFMDNRSNIQKCLSYLLFMGYDKWYCMVIIHDSSSIPFHSCPQLSQNDMVCDSMVVCEQSTR